MKNVVSILQHFGLNDKEASTYLASLELGPASIQKLSQCARLNRSTVHFVTDKLRKKGLMGETRRGKKRLLFAEDPDKFKEILSQDKANVKIKESALVDLLPFLQNIEMSADRKPQVRFYEGTQGFYDICNRSLNNAKKEILFLSSYVDFIKVSTDDKYDENYYIPIRLKKGILIRMLVFKNEWAQKLRVKQKEELRELKYIPPNFKFKSSIFIYGDEFSMISSQAPFLGVVIESKELAHTMKQIYEMLWAVSE